MALFGKVRTRWRMAGWLADLEADGKTLMEVPADLVGEVSALKWRRKVEQASDRWATDDDNVSFAEWRSAMSEGGRHRKGKPRAT